MEKIFKLDLPDHQACNGAIISAWAKLGGVSISALEITEEYNNMKKSLFFKNSEKIQTVKEPDDKDQPTGNAGDRKDNPSSPTQ